MAATDAPATLSEMRTAFLNYAKDATGVTAINTIVDRTLNTALQDMHQERWWWAERRATIRTLPPYTTGTVDVAITSLTTRRTVTGTSTLWNTANTFGDTNAAAAMKMTLGSVETVHTISSISSDTSLLLDTATPYTGTAALDDAGYAVYQDEYAMASDFDPRSFIDARHFDEERRIVLIGSQEFYRLYPVNSFRGKPMHATVIELGPSGSALLRPRVLFGPAPDGTQIIPYRYYTTSLAVSSTGTVATNLSAASDEPIVPMAFRMGIIWKALEIWHASRSKNPAVAADFAARYTALMLRARQRTGEADDKPRLVPLVTSGRAKRPWLRGAHSRFGGTEWDQLRT